MKIVINDANLLFDMLDCDLVIDFCQLPYQMFVTDAVLGEFDDETLSGYKDVLEKDLLRVHRLSVEDVKKVHALQRAHSKALTFPDYSCLFLAKEMSAILLTGDKALRRAAQANRLRVHGTLWVMDELLKAKIIDHEKAYQKLSFLMQINKRLPRIESKNRLKAWFSLIRKS